MSDDYWIRIDENGVGHCVIGSDLDDLNTPEEALKKAYEKGKEDGIAEANLKHNIECGDCARQIAAADEARIRADEREKVISEMLSKLRPCVDEAIRTMEVSHVYDMANILAKYKKEICHDNN